MSEKGSADGPKISFSLNGNKFQMRPDNSEVHTYSRVPETDHLIIRRIEQNKKLATRAFRAAFPMFDKWAEFMRENGWTPNDKQYPEDNVFMMYRSAYGEPDLHISDELTPRNERKLAFDGWMLQSGLVVPESFSGTL